MVVVVVQVVSWSSYLHPDTEERFHRGIPSDSKMASGKTTVGNPEIRW